MKMNLKLVAFIAFCALLVQLAMAAYHNISGEVTASSAGEQILIIFFSTVLSFILAVILIYFDLKLIDFLDRRYLWREKPVQRIIIEFLFVLLISVSVSSAITYLSNLFERHPENLTVHLAGNALITIILNLAAVAILESYLFFRDWYQENLKAERLEKENAIAKFETLKSQVNPHFLYNSLNVLQSLVRKDPSTAESYISEFARFYRYMLEISDQNVVELEKELEFVKDYLRLQKYRFGEGLSYDIRINHGSLHSFIPPLSLQTTVENAIKHNIISLDKPLQVEIYDEDGFLMIKNNLQKKQVNSASTGKGIDNLKRRYSFISDSEPLFVNGSNDFTVKLPLIEED